MSPPSKEPIDALERLAELCIEAKGIATAGGEGLRTINRLVEILLFEIGAEIGRASRGAPPTGSVGT